MRKERKNVKRVREGRLHLMNTFITEMCRIVSEWNVLKKFDVNVFSEFFFLLKSVLIKFMFWSKYFYER